jgi:hypothetical protein
MKSAGAQASDRDHGGTVAVVNAQEKSKEVGL